MIVASSIYFTTSIWTQTIPGWRPRPSPRPSTAFWYTRNSQGGVCSSSFIFCPSVTETPTNYGPDQLGQHFSTGFDYPWCMINRTLSLGPFPFSIRLIFQLTCAIGLVNSLPFPVFDQIICLDPLKKFYTWNSIKLRIKLMSSNRWGAWKCD